jgi:hypothetical protein
MNERIKQLALQAGIQDNPDQEGLEKFAELIVRDCAEWIVANAESMEHLGPAFFAKAMKTEFGVEE